MRKVFAKSVLKLVIMFSSIFMIGHVKANTINSIEMNIYIDSYGNAEVTEVWQANLQQGTEGYRSFSKLGNATIYNFTVKDDSGKIYTSLSTWRTGASLADKAYKSGINYLSDGLELCWGISEYGNRVYTLNYNIDNFVVEYTDKQGIYFNLLNLKQYVNKAKIVVHSDYNFSLDNTRIWGFGYDGNINFVDGTIVMDSEGSLSSSQSMVLLVRFENNIFNTTNTSFKSFDDIYDSVFDNDEYDDENISTNQTTSITTRVKFLKMICWLTIGVVVIFIIYLFITNKKSQRKSWTIEPGRLSENLDFGSLGRRLPDDSTINYYRNIPCNKDLIRAYWVANKYSVVSTNVLKSGIIGSIILKWMKEEKISIIKTKSALLGFKDNNYAIDFNNMVCADNEIENELFRMLKLASGNNKILESKELYEWCQSGYEEIEAWFSNILKTETQKLIAVGLISEEKEKEIGMYEEKIKLKVRDVSEQLREDALQLKGLKKFLLNFSLIVEKQHFDVHIWEEYLIFAQLLGIADKVQEQFSDLYPEFKEISKLDSIVTTTMIRNVEKGITKGKNKKQKMQNKNNHDYSGSTRASGSGGSSYSNGGSSAGGANGGGFR